jgi:hypothetical protein
MQNNRFVVLTGHLSNYPLSDLVGILRHQRKTGRLTIEYPKSPGIFFFQEGELVDAQLHDLTGLQAVCVALTQPEAAFNFNPLIQPSRRSIAPSFQRVVSELFGCWDESALQIEGTAIVDKEERSLPTADTPSNTPELIPPGNPQPLQLPPAPQMGIQRRSLLFVGAAGFVMLGLSTVIALSGRLNSARPFSERTTSENTLGATTKSAQTEMQKHTASANETSKTGRTSEQLRRQDNRVSTGKRETKNESASSTAQLSQTTSAVSNEQDKKATDSVASPQSVNVIMQIENGRVLNASIEGHKPGMDSYEGLALRIAKQRRYPSKVTGQESIKISVARPN